MKYSLQESAYDREKAVAYAHRWAYFRNPQYYNFEELGGDCTNFASQCILAGGGVMNYTPTMGWYYISIHDRAPAWTGVKYLYQFLSSNQGPGPYGREVSIQGVEPGDLVQLSFDREDYQHTPVVVAVNAPTLEGIQVAAHSRDCDHRPLSSYEFRAIRFVHIDGVRIPVRMEEN